MAQKIRTIRHHAASHKLIQREDHYRSQLETDEEDDIQYDLKQQGGDHESTDSAYDCPRR